MYVQPSFEMAQRIARTTWLTALVGGVAFVLGVVLHPGRSGWEIAAAPQYAIVHEVIAFGLAVQLASLVGFRLLFSHRLGRGGAAFWLAFAGQLLYFALIMFDGSHNPLMARLAPEIVHTPADADGATLLFVLPALIVFPLGYVVWGLALYRASLVPALASIFCALGAVLYALGGIAIFILGPTSPFISASESIGAVMHAFGLAWSARLALGKLELHEPDAASTRVAALRCSLRWPV